MGDTADGFPGLPGWGAKGTATVLARWGSIDAIPDSHLDWDVPGLRGAEKLAATLRTQRADAALFRTIATAVTTVPVGKVDDWQWRGPTDAFAAVTERIGAPELVGRARALADKLGVGR